MAYTIQTQSLSFISIYFIYMIQQEESPPNYHPTYTGILSINNYQEEPQQQVEAKAELPLDQIEQILSESHTNRNRRQVVLILAINYLQERCSELTSSNNYLQFKLQDMADELQFLYQVEIDQETAHNFLNVIQNQILTYKQDFKEYHARSLATNRQILQQNEQLKGKIQQLQSTLFQHQQQLAYIQEQNDSLSGINAQLNQKIEELHERLTTKANNRRFFNRKLQSQIQAELQAMIEQLVQEVQNQRNQKYQYSNELKHLQNQLMHLEKELQEKNSKIYDLQIKNLKSNRNSPQPIKNAKLRQTYEPTFKTKESSKRNDSIREKSNSNFTTFPLIYLIDQNGDFNKKIRLIIALKVIEFFIRKIKKRQFTQQTLQSLLVHNYSSLYPQACIIRKDKLSISQANCNQTTFIHNLVSIIDGIIHTNQPTPSKPAELQLANFMNSIVEDSCELNDADALLMLVQQAIRHSK